jgi:hypothetical protein
MFGPLENAACPWCCQPRIPAHTEALHLPLLTFDHVRRSSADSPAAAAPAAAAAAIGGVRGDAPPPAPGVPAPLPAQLPPEGVTMPAGAPVEMYPSTGAMGLCGAGLDSILSLNRLVSLPPVPRCAARLKLSSCGTECTAIASKQPR